MIERMRRTVMTGLLVAMALGLLLYVSLREIPESENVTIEPPNFVGGETCARCHEPQAELWRGSHHHLAMQVANEDTVLGDFDDATLTHFGVTSTFFKRDEKFFVRTEGPYGELHDYDVAYTFGALPLQQYLVPFPGGRYQALTLAWDTRPAAEGGLRWFHLQPEERIPAGDALHWTGPGYNWNYMCAECHSTNLEKNYSLEEDRYQTTWSEIDVSCEACHGPGSRHVSWAEAVPVGGPADAESDMTNMTNRGLVVRLGDFDHATWIADTETGLSRREPPRQSRVVIEMCARCHSRRSIFEDDYVYGRSLMDTHRPALLDETLYYADGQIEEEVYEYGSFLQSKMYREGVTCQDCHDPHSLAVRATGNAVCASCHLPEKFDTPAHHFHRAESPGAQCVECHMPARTYMVVDPRRDHSFRVPRPDLTVDIGAPNACNGCHTDRTAIWAVDTVVRWYGPERYDATHYGEAIHAGRRGLANAESALIELADDVTMPAIARATAVSLLERYLSQQSLPTIERSLASTDPLLRSAAVEILSVVEPLSRLALGYPLLNDPVRQVRLEATRVLASVADQMSAAQRPAFDRALEEYRAAQRVNADRPGYHLNLSVVDQQLGDLESAERSLRTALRLDPSFAPAYVNLADVFRLKGQDEEGERVLREGLSVAPEDASLYHALGLLLTRGERQEEAVEALGRASVLQPENARYSYVYGVALHSAGETDRALEVLDAAHRREPANRELLIALVTISRENGAVSRAVEYGRKLVALSPQDPAARQLLEQLER
jgi:Flp pilus assembly protein TadD